MPTSYTTNLGLALPVTGELAGTWGDVVNEQITDLLDSAVAGTTTLSADSDVTLTSLDGLPNQARQAIILWTASGTVTRAITAPAHSKVYVVINKSATQSIIFRATGPTTGVTLLPLESAVVAWNGTDYIKAVDLGGDVTFNSVTATGADSNFGSTGALAISAGTTGERPVSPPGPSLRYNSTLEQFEGYDGSEWGGIGGAQAGGVIQVNKTEVTVDYTLPTGSNGFSVGPITIDSGITVTISSGQVWVII